MSAKPIGRLPWRAAIWPHARGSDTVCIKDADDNEIVGWMGFDGVVGTKAQIRQRARMIVKAVNALHSTHQHGAGNGENPAS